MSAVALASALVASAAPPSSSARPGPSAVSGPPLVVEDGAARAARIPPDPPSMTERQQWLFDLRWDKGDVYLLEIQSVDMGEPRTTPRVFGRFALELFEGPTLIERVRFDFPLLGAGADQEDAGRGFRAPPRLTAKLRSRIGVYFPATKRGTRLELWDRATDVRYPLPWPPRAGTFGPPSAASAEGGAPASVADR